MAGTPTSNSSVPLALYTHVKCEQWGLAILAWERGACRAYQFEDGTLRIFKEGYFEMLAEVDAPADKTARVIADLKRKLGDAAHRGDGTPDPTPVEPELSFEDQIRAFLLRYPDGFGHAAWIAKYRDSGDGRRKKQHAEPLFAEARERLGQDVIDEALVQNRASEIHAATIQLIEHSSLLTTTQLDPLRAQPHSRHTAFARALRELLHGTDAYELRFERYVSNIAASHRRDLTWQLVTVLPALVFPTEHVCVRPATFKEQARWMAPRLTISKAPTAATYVRLVDMVMAVKAALEAAGLAPRDLMDVYDFMVLTLGASSKRLLAN